VAVLNEEDIERLASRLAMVVSEDGEAENAGRAMGQFARRLGITGGQLKEMLVRGAAAVETVGPAPGRAGEVERLEQELAALRGGNRMLENACRAAERDRDALQAEVTSLRAALYRRRRGSSRTQIMAAGLVIGAIFFAGLIAWIIPSLDPPSPPPRPPVADQGPPERRTGFIHVPHAAVFVQPDRNAPVVATLPAGMPVVVRRLLWNMLMQWAEIEVGGTSGYVLTTDLDLT
jgi:hypothetical protein